jgi:hypothetical protein
MHRNQAPSRLTQLSGREMALDPATMHAVAAWRDVGRCKLAAFHAELADERASCSRLIVRPRRFGR